jgi:hypothetical protein
MKKLLFSIVGVFLLFSLNAQIPLENFSGFTTGGKIAQQAQAMGKDYWTTWSNVPGGSEDGVIDEMPAGNKCGKFVGTASQSIDQILRLGTKNGSVWEPKTTGKWELTFKIYIPTGKDGYFNIKSVFPSTVNGTWAMQIYMGTDEGDPGPATPGVGKIYGGSSTGVSFNFAHDTWVPIKIFIDLDDDIGEFYVNGILIHTYQYSTSSFGGENYRSIAAFNIFPSNYAATTLFYIDDIEFVKVTGSEVLFETGFDDKPNGSYVAQSYPLWWTTWENAPGTGEDALITNEQSQTPNHSAKCSYATGTDLVFKAGNKTSGKYTIDFDMYIPSGGIAYFNLLQIFAGSGSEWAVGVYFNVTATGMPQGTNIRHNNQLTPFTFPYATWFPIHFDIDLDSDQAKIKINNVELLTWQFSIPETGGTGTRQLAAADFYPPQSGSVYYIDNFKYTLIDDGGPTAPIIVVTPNKIEETLYQGDSITKPVKVENIGTSIGEYTSWIEYDFEPITGSSIYPLQHCNDYPNDKGLAYPVTTPTLMELGAKFSGTKLCDKVGTYITKLSYYLPAGMSSTGVNSLTFRVYGPNKANAPGEVLATVTKTSGVSDGAWHEVTLATPVLIDKNEIWISVEFMHNVGAYPISADEGNLGVEGVNFTRRDGGAWVHFNQYNEFGNFLVKAESKGTVVPACWLSISGDTYGNIPKGDSKTFNANLKTTGLAIGEYKAKIIVITNDEANPLVTIPCTLTVQSTIPYSLMVVNPTFLDKEIKGEETITVPVKITNSGETKGDYIVVEPTVDWISISGNTFFNDLEPDAFKFFDVTFDAAELEDDVYTTDIVINVPNDVIDVIKIPCTLKVDKLGVGKHAIKTLVYPNPATNSVTVKSTQIISSVQIINFVGQTVYSANVNKDFTNINTSDLTGGIYFLKVNTDAGTQNIKLIIK